MIKGNIFMTQKKLHEIILDIYTKAGINTFPIDCVKVAQALGIPLHKYSDLSKTKQINCFSLSDNAFKLYGEIYFNDKFPHKGRQRFTIMHEIGHIIFEHSGELQKNEDEADIFASNILAPRIMIHRYRCETSDQIHDIFGLSYDASNRALTDYRKWYENIAQTTHKPSEPERQLELLMNKRSNQDIDLEEDEDEEYEPTPEEMYADIQRALKAGLPIPPEYSSTYQMYRKIGLK